MIQVTKFTHSCLYVQTEDRAILIDPGKFSYESEAFSMDKITKLDRIAITHEHADHLHLPFLKELCIAFPDAHIVANKDVQAIVAKEVSNELRDTTGCTVAFESPHDSRIPWAPKVPHQTGFHIKDQLTHPGDSITTTKSMRILAQPVTAPWGPMSESLLNAIDVGPEIVLPIHDWHWNEQARQAMYDMAEKFLAQHDIKFIPLVDGETVSL